MSNQSLNRKTTRALSVPRTLRNHNVKVLTSLPAGKSVPLLAIPLLREDAVRSGTLRFSFEMMETAELLMNAVNVQLSAYLVPTLALERFEGSMDILNRSYSGVAAVEGGSVIPFIETHAMGTHGSKDVYKYLGLHAKSASLVNTQYLESYNAIFNYRAKNRSPDLAERTRLDATLAPAFWQHTNFAHIVPDFDQAAIDGEVPLNVVQARLPVRGIGIGGADFAAASGVLYRETDAPQGSYPKGWQVTSAAPSSGLVALKIKEDPNKPFFPDIYAELQQDGITVSLSNIEMAKKTAAFAKLRQQYSGHNDDWLIDMLMSGLSIPDQALKHPMLLAQNNTVFGMSKRYATDGGNLAESVVNGATFIDLAVRLPRLATGGVIMVIAEITPEQLFERQKDSFFHTSNVEAFPDYLRDTLDPEKVSVVTNDFVDIDHDTPNATFGYAPLNHEWANSGTPKIGGKFYRPEVDAAFDEDRQRIWAVETQNPTLSTDFYLCTNMHTKPFADQNGDPFEGVGVGNLVIEGNTVFGGHLIEASDDYEMVLAKAPQDRIEKAQ